MLTTRALSFALLAAGWAASASALGAEPADDAWHASHDLFQSTASQVQKRWIADTKCAKAKSWISGYFDASGKSYPSIGAEPIPRRVEQDWRLAGCGKTVWYQVSIDADQPDGQKVSVARGGRAEQRSKAAWRKTAKRSSK